MTPAETAAIGAELDNLRAALGWVANAAAGADLVVPLAGVSDYVWGAALHLAEGLEWCLALRRHVHDGVPPRDAARYWLTVARLGIYSTRREGFDAALRAADLYRLLGDDSLRYSALVCAAAQGMRFGSIQEMEWAIAEATRLVRSDWPAWWRASLPFARCWWYSRLGRYEEALICAQEQVDINREGGEPAREQYAMANVTAMELLLGRPEVALERARAAIARLDALDARAGAGHLYTNVMIALILLNRLDEAVSAGRTAHRLLLQEGDEYRLFAPLALLAGLQGRFAASARIIGRDDAVHTRAGDAVLPNAAQLRARLDPLLAVAVPAPELARLRKGGATMGDEQVFKLGFGDGP